MKRFIVAILTLYVSVIGMAQQVVLRKADGTQVKLHVSEFTDISFQSQDWVDPTGEPNRNPMSFSATFEHKDAKASGMHKVQFAGDATKSMAWQEGDMVSVMFSDKNEKFTLADGSGTAIGKFSGVISGTSNKVWVLSPYSAGVSLVADGVIAGVRLPMIQKAVENTFDRKAGVMMAVKESEDILSAPLTIGFRNVCSYLQFTIPADRDFDRIVVRTVDGTPLTGTVSVNYNDGQPSWNVEGDNMTSSSATLTGPLERGKTYYLAVLPGTFEDGFIVDAYANGQCVSKTYAGATSFNRSQWHDCSAMIATEGSPYIVDLGLGDSYHRYWAPCNVGAVAPYDFGGYFAWGEVEEKDRYTFAGYKHGDGQEHDLNNLDDAFVRKYFSGDNISGLVADDKTQLDLTDDAARVVMQDMWRIPSKDDVEQLMACPHEFTSDYKGSGIQGFVFYHKDYQHLVADGQVDASKVEATLGKDITHIFLPMGGYKDNIGGGAVGPNSDHGYYWTNTVCENNVGQSTHQYHYSQAYDLVLLKGEPQNDNIKLSSDFRRGGQNIRAVYDGTPESSMVLPVIKE